MAGRTFDPERVKSFCVKVLEKTGMNAEDAHIAAEVLVTTDMRGVRTHGTLQLRVYVRQVLSGGMNPKADIEVIKEGSTWAIVDGHAGSGVVTANKAMKLAMAKAREHVIGIVGVRNSNHFGAAGYYATMCLDEDMIGLAMTNGDPTMSAPGAAGRIVSNNPIAYAVPAGEEYPITLDVALSVVAGVKVHQAAREGRLVPEGWILDSSGRPTTDPIAFETGGAHVPIGGHKGFGMALMVEILAGVMTHSGVTQEVLSAVAHPASASHVGHFFMAINVGSIEPIDEFKARMDKLIREIRSTPKAQGVERIYLPGEMEWEQEKAAKAKGVILDEATLNNLKLLSREMGLEADGFWNE